MARPLVEAASLGAVAKMAHGESPKVRLISEATYQAGSWSKERRVVYKVEVLEKGMNTRFVVSNRPEESARTLYDDYYIQRGETENRIKDYKNALRAERLSCCKFLANQFRLFLHAAAYWLLDTLGSQLSSKGWRRMQLDTLRLRLVKIGGRVRQLVGKVRLHLSSGHPGQILWRTLSSMAEPAYE
jgi:hypothetical protein